ncbi:MAG: transporter family substrate-binding protein, partial [Microbacteriaceae bacterium]|nr:transporter family substrate-binding protein [Microbacteriaceae bacterium]
MKLRTRARTRATVAAAAALALAATLAGCTGPTLVEGSTVSVAVPAAVTSLNPKTSYGNAAANSAVAAATSAQFAAYDATPQLVDDPSFGSATVVSQQPFTVKFTIASGVMWSDGAPVDAGDLLLSWAANSGNLNTKGFDPSRYTDDDGRFTGALPKGVVHFDGFSGNGLQLVTKTPVIGDGGRSLTLAFDRYFPDWKLVVGVGVPAHVVATKALGIRSPAAASKALIAAIQHDDTGRLSAIASTWNSAFNLTTTPKDRSLLVSDGPYTVTAISPTKVTLAANRRYTGAHRPQFEHVVLRTISDPLAAVKALADGTVDVATPQPSADVDAALRRVDGATVTTSSDGTWEQLDLQSSKSRNGTFDDERVRRAFLDVVPRQQILDRMVRPLQRGASNRDSFVFLPGSAGYAQSVATNGSKQFARVDVAGAKALLAKAGVTAPQVCILFDPANPRRVAEFGLIQKSAALAGFVVTDCSSASWRDQLGTPGAYDASLYALKPSTLAVSSVAASFRSNSTVDNTS